MTGTDVTDAMLRQLRHDVWATDKLIAHCRQLPAEQLQLSVPGTYGTVLRTLQHVVSADENYVVRLLGALLHEPPFRVEPDVGLDVIASHVPHVADAVERLFASGDLDGDRLIGDTPLRRPEQPRFEINAWVPLTQFVQHGNDHRAQICTTLSAHGIEPPDLQVWPYAMELGASREAKEA
jgi:uncharacterized damage-inducible protein DinB